MTAGTWLRMLLLILVAGTLARAGSPTDSAGWRGNYTGIWADSKAPVTWEYRTTGVMAGVTCTNANQQPGDAHAAELKVSDGFLRHWLVLGPIEVADSVKDFDVAQVQGEAELAPVEGDKNGELTWAKLESPAPGRYTFGSTELQYVDVGKAVGFKKNEVAYAVTYVHAAKAGKVRAVVEHGHGMKAWLNGKEIYKNPQRGDGLGTYVGISRNKLDYTWPKAPSFEMDLKEGTNRLVVKISSTNKGGWTDMRFSLWLMDLPDAPVVSKNIKWRTEMPERSTSSPIVVGEKLFVMSEPDELLCLDARSGKVLWSQYVNFYEAMTDAEKKEKPEYASQVDPLVTALKKSTDDAERLSLRKQIDELLKKIDKERFAVKMEGHLSSHFGVVGYTTPMPCCDGKNVYVFVGTGIAACFDLDGNRKWITRLDSDQLVYPAGGAVIGGKFVVFFKSMIAFDCATGKEAWRQEKVNRTSGSLVPATLAGVDVVIGQKGDVVRASDGHMLWDNPDKISGDTGWNPPVVLGDVMYLPWYGAAALHIRDFSKCTGDEWKPEIRNIGNIVISKGPDGKWLDKWSAGSPLVHDGMAYTIDMYGTFYAVDLEAGKLAYRQDLDIRGLQHYNAIGVAASPTLIGNHVVVLDNQGTAFVIAPGKEFKLEHVNRIESTIQRTVALPPQEILSYSPPVSDGKRLFLRGEKYLWCIGE